MRAYITGSVRLVAAPLLLAGVAAGIAPVTAAAARTGPGGPAASTFSGHLSGVAATSAANAWAVGSTGSSSSPKTLIVHWNGTAWAQVPSPAPAGGAELSGVAAASVSSAWAVGCTSCFTSSPKTLILRWNGKAWTQVPSPSPGARSGLSSVAATSAGNAWAVGGVVSSSSSPGTGLILHWNGKAWGRVPSPLPPAGKFGNGLAGVAATSAANAWAVGCTDGCPVGGTPVIERWNGTVWKQVAAPTTPFALYNLTAVAATSTANAWAVGGGGPATAEGTAAAQWNGRSWTLSPGISGAELTGVTATSATNAWAVGGTANGHTLILHWNGTTWKLS
jgi:hypothetical protein